MDAEKKEQYIGAVHETHPIDPDMINLGPIDRCGTENVVRELKNTLYLRGDGADKLTVPVIDFTPLRLDLPEVRLLTLHPSKDLAKHVQCSVSTHSLVDLPSFVAIKNARGYRKFQDVIEIDGQALIISCALDRFLRYFQSKIRSPTRIWVRYACVMEHDPQEQKTYWTREFSDKMYALASQVFDMHEINTRLIENGYFEKTIDLRDARRNKEWEDQPRQMVLPRVCPVRLGTQSNNDIPTVDYQYMPLDSIADEIRIMCIMPAKDTSAPIVIHVAHSPRDCDVTYVALSYRWGTDETPEQIVLNGQRKTIRKNLAEAIRTLRMTEMIVPMWIDAISINQDDMAERDRQVQRMGQIYDFAMKVYSYVGKTTEDTALALEFVEELQKHPVVLFNSAGEFDFGKWDGTGHGGNRIKLDRLVILCVSLYRFLTRKYFRRVWILQEVAWASNPTIIAGRRLGTPFRNLDMAAYNLLSMLARDPSLAGQMQAAEPSLKVNIDLLAFPRKVFYFRYMVSKGSGGGSMLIPSYKIEKTSPGYLEALVLTRNFECTDPRDHIFGIWGLAQDKEGLQFKPAYSESYEKVYEDFTRAWIAQHGKLDILGTVEATQQSYEFYSVAPSWCPNWNVTAITSCLVRKDYIPTRFMSGIRDQSGKLYSADGNMDQDSFCAPLYSFENKALDCHGIIIDQIKVVLGDAPDIPAGSAPKSTWRFHYWTTKLRDICKKYGMKQYDDPLRAAWAMFHGDSVAAWPPVAESGYEPGICHSNEEYVCVPRLSRHVLMYSMSYDRTEAWSVVDKVLRGRRPFFTNDGYIGLAPAHIADAKDFEQIEWSLAVVAGCSVPLVLRERKNGTFELIGTCFVQGWMDGEWMTTMMDTESPKEFWDAMRDCAKLVIT